MVEIASPSTAGFDRRDKQNAYARAAAPEYWIADPATQTIEVLVLEPAVSIVRWGCTAARATRAC